MTDALVGDVECPVRQGRDDERTSDEVEQFRDTRTGASAASAFTRLISELSR